MKYNVYIYGTSKLVAQINIGYPLPKKYERIELEVDGESDPYEVALVKSFNMLIDDEIIFGAIYVRKIGD